MNRLQRKVRQAVRPSIHAAAGAVIFVLLVAAQGDPVAPGGAEGAGGEADALARLDDSWSDAATARDADRVASYYAEDAVAYPPNEPAATGRDAARALWAGMLADPTLSISWKTAHAGVTGDLGYTAGTYELSFQGEDGRTVEDRGKYLCVWKKQADGSWKAIHDMWNSDLK